MKTKKINQIMTLRIEYSRETDLIFSDDIPKYADWLENKLAKFCTNPEHKEWEVKGICLFCKAKVL
jgi:hypothetical protein